MKTTTKKILKQNHLSRFGAALLITILFAMAATNALAALIAHEPYNYTLGAAPTAATGTPTQTTGGGFSSGYNGGGLRVRLKIHES